jgi:hypothetical protein
MLVWVYFVVDILALHRTILHRVSLLLNIPPLLLIHPLQLLICSVDPSLPEPHEVTCIFCWSFCTYSYMGSVFGYVFKFTGLFCFKREIGLSKRLAACLCVRKRACLHFYCFLSKSNHTLWAIAHFFPWIHSGPLQTRLCTSVDAYAIKLVKFYAP